MTMMAKLNEYDEACCCRSWCDCRVGIEIIFDTNVHLFLVIMIMIMMMIIIMIIIDI